MVRRTCGIARYDDRVDLCLRCLLLFFLSLLLLATNLSLHILLFSKERSPYDGRTYESYRHDVHIGNGVFEWVSLGALDILYLLDHQEFCSFLCLGVTSYPVSLYRVPSTWREKLGSCSGKRSTHPCYRLTPIFSRALSMNNSKSPALELWIISNIAHNTPPSHLKPLLTSPFQTASRSRLPHHTPDHTDYHRLPLHSHPHSPRPLQLDSPPSLLPKA